jgi:hypothetical protein
LSRRLGLGQDQLLKAGAPFWNNHLGCLVQHATLGIITSSARYCFSEDHWISLITAHVDPGIMILWFWQLWGDHCMIPMNLRPPCLAP